MPRVDFTIRYRFLKQFSSFTTALSDGDREMHSMIAIDGKLTLTFTAEEMLDKKKDSGR